ncbi:MAG TPA: response regulator [Planctomycetota bacterium]
MTDVLIADNDRAVSGLLTEILVRAGLSPVHAYDGHTAGIMARQPGLRVIVCDLDMPRVSGLEVLESLRDLPNPPRAVVVSGYLDADVRERLGKLPFVRHVLSKPFDLQSFAERVQQLVAEAAVTLPPPDVAGSAGCQ